MERPRIGTDKNEGFWEWLKRVVGGQKPPATTPTPSPTPRPKPPEPTYPPEEEPQPPISPTPPVTSRRFDTTLARNSSTMRQQLEKANQYRSIIEEAARRFDFLPSVLCGIGSRESHWGLALRPPHPGGTGDFSRRRPRGDRTGSRPPDGGGYGRGLMQIDYDWHEFARTGNWQDPRENIFYACQVLEDARTFFKRRVSLNDYELLRATLAAYNGGATATLRAIQAGKDIDANTTGRDYSHDVLNRSGWFQLHGWR